jgi:Tfp pilus assembly protein PilN
MIRINLLPEELRGARGRASMEARVARQGLSPVVILAILLIVAADAAFAWWVFDSRLEAIGERKEKDAKLAELNKKINEKYEDFQELKLLDEKVDNQLSVLESLAPPDRILWYEKLNMLARLVHPSVFITKLQLDEHVTEIETTKSLTTYQEWMDGGKIGPEPPHVKIPQITQTLAITAVTTGKNEVEQHKNALDFLADLQTYEAVNEHGDNTRFMDGFQPEEFGKWLFDTRELYKGREVCQFTYTLTTVPTAGESASAL